MCTATGDQTNPSVVSDGAGGAIVVWQDSRSGAPDIYAHHVLATGILDAAWPASGLAVAVAADSQITPVALEDGASGALITWQDKRNGAHSDIYAHHVLPNGALDANWPALGRVICGASGNQQRPRLEADGSGGAIVVWSDQRPGVGSDDIYASRVTATGSIATGWPADGTVVCGATGAQQFPVIVPDGFGGALVSWADSRAGTTNFDIYVHHLLGSGTVDGSWPSDGRAVCTAVGLQQNPAISEDGAHGAIVAWQDARGGVSDIYAHRVKANGVLDPGWTTDGVLLCGATNTQAIGGVAFDGTGGAIVTWTDFRNGGTNPDVYAGHILGSGAVDAVWTADGVAVSTATASQASPKAIPDGAGGAIVVWTDARSGATNSDIYAQRVQGNGQLGGTVVDVPQTTARGLELGPISPNPVRRGAIHVNCMLPSGTGQLELLDMAGRRLEVRHVDGGARTSITLPVSELPPGVYFVRLTHRMLSLSRRIVLME